MKFTYRGTKCEVYQQPQTSAFSFAGFIGGYQVTRWYSKELHAISGTKVFIDQIISNAKESGK